MGKGRKGEKGKKRNRNMCTNRSYEEQKNRREWGKGKEKDREFRRSFGLAEGD